MPSEPVIVVSSLLQPIADDNPAGLDPRQDKSPNAIYSRIRDARKAARAAERNNLFESTNTEADELWRQVRELSPQVLKNNAKDLEIASWYVESLVRKDGFTGLRDGFSLIRQLIEVFWENIYPLPDEDGMTTRVAALTGLNGTDTEGVLIAPIRTVAITDKRKSTAYSYWQYKQALEAQRVIDPEARAAQIAKNQFSLDDILKAVNQADANFYINLRDDVRDALDEYKRIGQLLNERCGERNSPPTRKIIDILTDTLDTIHHIAKSKLPAADAESGTDTVGTDAATGDTAGYSGKVNSRAEAFRQLSHISQFFRQTEPHSPVSYVIEKAVRWGDMSLGELMQELIPDSTSRSTYSSLTGVNTADNGAGTNDD